jgi:hypothetical protein
LFNNGQRERERERAVIENDCTNIKINNDDNNIPKKKSNVNLHKGHVVADLVKQLEIASSMNDARLRSALL